MNTTSNRTFFRQQLNGLAGAISGVRLRKTLTFTAEPAGPNIYIWLGTDTKAYEDEDGTAHSGRMAWFAMVNFAAKDDPQGLGLLDIESDKWAERVADALDAEPAAREADNTTTGSKVIIEQIQVAAVVPFASEDLNQGGLQVIGYLDYIG